MFLIYVEYECENSQLTPHTTFTVSSCIWISRLSFFQHLFINKTLWIYSGGYCRLYAFMLPNQQQHYKIHVTEGLLWHWPWPCYFGVDYSQVRYCKDCKSWQVMTCITNLSKMDWQTFASRPTDQDHKDWSRESRPMPGLVLTLEMQTKELRRRPSPTGRGCCSWELASRLRASTLQVIVSCSKVIFKMWGTDEEKTYAC